jgi:tetratricopeptide (TPR) repeat protein
MRLKSYEEAAVMYAKAVELEPRNSFARFMQGMSLVRLRRYRAARSLFEEGLLAHQEDVDTKHALARLLAACPEAALRDGRRALELAVQVFRSSAEPDFEYGQTLAMALAEAGEFDQAVSLQRSLLDVVKRANRKDLAPLLAANLERYQNRKACRLPWPDDDPVFSPVPGPPAPLSSVTPTTAR